MTKEEKCRLGQIGRVTIHFGDYELKVYKNELSKYLEQGWQKGYSEKHKKSLSNVLKGRPGPTKGVPCPEEKKKRISETLKKNDKINPDHGWRNYWKTDHQAWNKGLKKEPDKRVNKISQLKMGHEVTLETRKKNIQTTKGRKVPQDKLLIRLSKAYITKKLHNSFNSSKSEELFYKSLLDLNKNFTIYKQYKDKQRYPFYCDFYIKELDLFIELNFHWTHGQHPFNIKNPNDVIEINKWKEKAKTSEFYKTAVYVWAERDPKKRNIAKQNKLNYIELFNQEDVNNFIKNII